MHVVGQPREQVRHANPKICQGFRRANKQHDVLFAKMRQTAGDESRLMHLQRHAVNQGFYGLLVDFGDRRMKSYFRRQAIAIVRHVCVLGDAALDVEYRHVKWRRHDQCGKIFVLFHEHFFVCLTISRAVFTVNSCSHAILFA